MKPSMFGVCFCVVGLVGPASAAGEDKPTPLCSIPVGEKDPDRRRDVQWMAFLPGGRHVAVRTSLPPKVDGYQDAAVEVYDITTGKVVAAATIKGGGKLNIASGTAECAVSPKGDWVAFVGKNSNLEYLVVPPHKPVLPTKIDLHLSTSACVRDRIWADSTGTGIFAVVGYDGEYSLRWLNLGKLNAEGVPQGRTIFKAGDPDADRILFALGPARERFAVAIVPHDADKKPAVQAWTLGEKPIKTVIALPMRAASLAIAPDGKTIAVGYPDGSVGWFDAASGQSFRHWKLAMFSVGSVAFHPDGKSLACGAYDAKGLKNLFFVNTGTGEVVSQFIADKSGVTSVCFSPNGDKLAAFGSSGTITIWDATKLLKLERD